MLDKGQEKDWFGSHWITAAVLLRGDYFGYRGSCGNGAIRNPIVELKLLKNRNFATAVFFMSVLGCGSVWNDRFDPGISAESAGLSRRAWPGAALAGGGVMMMFMMPLSGFLVSRVDPRV